MNRCPICNRGGLGHLEYKSKRTDKGRFTTYRCKVCNCCWHVAIYPGESVEHIDQTIRNYLLQEPKQKIAAIKALRAVTNLGLREAKDYVDGIENGLYASGQLRPNRNHFRIRGRQLCTR